MINIVQPCAAQFEKIVVELNKHTPSTAPLELQHLGLGEEYRIIVEGAVLELRSEGNTGAVLALFIFLAIAGGIGLSIALRSPYFMIIVGAVVLIVCICGFVSQSQHQGILDKAMERCNEANKSSNVAGRAQFTASSSTGVSYDTNGSHHHEKFIITIAYISSAPPDGSQVPLAAMGVLQPHVVGPGSGYYPPPLAVPVEGHNTGSKGPCESV